jgi:peroxiredoxin
MTNLRLPVAAGELAPDFKLPAVDGSGIVSLADYRGTSSVFLALFIGLWCPFCRRAIAQLAVTKNKLKPLGIETIAIVATSMENARLYFKYRPCRLRLLADPELSTHRAYRLPRPTPTPEFMKEYEIVRINPDGEFPEPLPIMEASATAAKFDDYSNSVTDQADLEQQWPQLKGQFMVNREGFVRWANIECAAEGLAGIGKFPSVDEILTAAMALQHD